MTRRVVTVRRLERFLEDLKTIFATKSEIEEKAYYNADSDIPAERIAYSISDDYYDADELETLLGSIIFQTEYAREAIDSMYGTYKAIYGVTTYSMIEQALGNGLLVYLYNSGLYMMLCAKYTTKMMFVGFSGETREARFVSINNDNVWSSDYPVTYLYPKISEEVMMPSLGFKPNVYYNLGTVSGSAIWLLQGTPGVHDRYYIQFSTGATEPTISWFTGVKWKDGSEPTLSANSTYRIEIWKGLADITEY